MTSPHPNPAQGATPDPAQDPAQASAPDSEPTPEPIPKPRLTTAQAKRASQSAKGMVISVLATLGIALLVFFLNPGSTPETYDREVDVTSTAEEAAAVADFHAVAPQVPEDWDATFARWHMAGADGVAHWEAGYVTADEDFVGFHQTAQANPTWLAQQMDNAPLTGSRTVDGTRWDLHEPVDGDRHLTTEIADSTVIVTGSGELETLDTLAAAIQRDLEQDQPQD